MGKARTQGEEKLRYKPMSFDIDKIVPDAAEGEYLSVIDQASVKTNRAQVPMVVIAHHIKKTNTKTKAAEKSVKSTVYDRISLFPDGDRRGNFGRRQLKQLLDALNVKVNDVMPRKLTGDDDEDFGDLLKALKKKKLTIWVTNKEDASGEMRANVFYTEPRGFMADSVEEEEEEEDEDEDEDEDKDEDPDEEDDEDDEDEDEDDEDEDDEDEDEDEKPKKTKGKKKKKEDEDDEDEDEDDEEDEDDDEDEEDEDEEDDEDEKPKKKKGKKK